MKIQEFDKLNPGDILTHGDISVKIRSVDYDHEHNVVYHVDCEHGITVKRQDFFDNPGMTSSIHVTKLYHELKYDEDRVTCNTCAGLTLIRQPWMDTTDWYTCLSDFQRKHPEEMK